MRKWAQIGGSVVVGGGVREKRESGESERKWHCCGKIWCCRDV